MLMNELGGRLGLTPRLFTYANSGDVSGDRSRVVGYGALVYEEGFQLSAEEGGALVTLARRALETYVRDGKRVPVPPELTLRFPRLGSNRAAFVTLPTSAIRTSNGTSTVTILDAGQPISWEIQTGATDGARTEIVAGLDEGTEVVLTKRTSSTTTSGNRQGGPGFGGVFGILR
jgi:hypothetical protein